MAEPIRATPLTLAADGTNQPPQVWLELIGQSYLERGFFSEAIAVFQMTVEVYPQSPNAHWSLGRAYETCGEIDLAAQSFKRASELHPAWGQSGYEVEGQSRRL